ncbi:hypothetical protein [Janthinobacterium fluminis]|uniref:Type II secretory pathway, pseudopilin PulG n=1 Tax=Janthinobacterium fluminis TaxID=2987524 RepID=A0ABT5K4M6_9BURK|nr:hypothetical protein [Janthinobacterium fluminis]MDC8759874.1 hypothetical protein [Janthinobacterium fluminis]
MAAKIPLRRQRGAALLILLSVVGLGVATLLISALGKNGQQGARERRALLALAEASDALVGYATSHGRLPRPARSAVDGRERPDACVDEGGCSGFLPWVTLGVGGADSWGKLLRYSVTPEFTVAPIQSRSAVATKTVRARSPDGRFYYLGGQQECGLSIQCLPFVVYSSGKNNLGTGVAGVAQANKASGNIDEQANDKASTHFIARAAGADPRQPGGEFDDLAAWVPLTLLYERMTAAHTLP